MVTFDPLTDAALPPGTAGIYLGGGFPEVHASELTANGALRRDLRAAIDGGHPDRGRVRRTALPLRHRRRRRDGRRDPRDRGDDPAADAVLPDGRPASATPCSPAPARRSPVTSSTAPTSSPAPGHRAPGRSTTARSASRRRRLHASYLHTHWAGHPQLAQRFADAVHAAVPPTSPSHDPAVPHDTVDPLRHHGDAETGAGLLDFAVNVYAGPRPTWLDAALHGQPRRRRPLPDVRRRRGRRSPPDTAGPSTEVLATAGAAEAFSLRRPAAALARPVVVHPQFTEPHAALEQAGHAVTEVRCLADDGFRLDPDAVPDDADLVVVGNPTNPTGVLHPAEHLIARCCGRADWSSSTRRSWTPCPASPSRSRTSRLPGLLVVRSLTKHWAIPGVRAGYVARRHRTPSRELRRGQVPWSVSTTAAAAMVACSTADRRLPKASGAQPRSPRGAAILSDGLAELGVAHIPSSALVRAGAGRRRRARRPARGGHRRTPGRHVPRTRTRRGCGSPYVLLSRPDSCSRRCGTVVCWTPLSRRRTLPMP